MVSYNDIIAEVQAEGQKKGIPLDLDTVRRAKLKAVEQVTGRPLIIYAVDMTNPQKYANNPSDGMLNLDDKDSFIEVTKGLSGNQLDVLLHGPGGLAEAAESIVALLRSQFNHIRFIIPSVAKSAATMLAMSADELVMGVSSELGPIDPQFIIGGKAAPAQAILEQFEQAKVQIQQNPSPAWIPILQMYGPSLLSECQHHIALAEELVSNWLETYMFRGDIDASQHAKDVAQKLNDHAHWRSHGRRIDMMWCISPDARLKVTNLDSNRALADAIRAAYLAIKVTFDLTPVLKIVENSQGDALMRVSAQVAQLVLNPPSQPAPGAPAQNPSAIPHQGSLPRATRQQQLPLSHRQRQRQRKP